MRVRLGRARARARVRVRANVKVERVFRAVHVQSNTYKVKLGLSEPCVARDQHSEQPCDVRFESEGLLQVLVCDLGCFVEILAVLDDGAISRESCSPISVP